MTILGTIENDKDLVVVVELYTDEETFYFSSLPINISGKTFIQAISKGSIGNIEKNFNISGGGNIGTVSSFELTIARYNNNLDISDIAPNTYGIQLENRLVRVGFTWINETDYSNINWINDFIIDDYSYDADKLNISCIDLVEEKYTELPKLVIQKDLDDGFSYFPDAPENVLGQPIPIIYGDYPYLSGIQTSKVQDPEGENKAKLYNCDINKFKFIVSQDPIELVRRAYVYDETISAGSYSDVTDIITSNKAVNILVWNDPTKSFHRLNSKTKIDNVTSDFAKVDVVGSGTFIQLLDERYIDENDNYIENDLTITAGGESFPYNCGYNTEILVSLPGSYENKIILKKSELRDDTSATFLTSKKNKLSEIEVGQIATQRTYISLGANTYGEVDTTLKFIIYVKVKPTLIGFSSTPPEFPEIIFNLRYDEGSPIISSFKIENIVVDTVYERYLVFDGGTNFQTNEQLASCYLDVWITRTAPALAPDENWAIEVYESKIGILKTIAKGIQTDIEKFVSTEENPRWLGKAIQTAGTIGLTQIGRAQSAMNAAGYSQAGVGGMQAVGATIAPVAIAMGAAYMVSSVMEEWGLTSKKEQKVEYRTQQSTVNMINNAQFFIACKGKLSDGNFI